MNIVVQDQKNQEKIRAAWAEHAAELTRWAYKCLYARDSAYPVWVKDINDWRCVHEDLTADVLRSHFFGTTTIGIYTLGLDSKCLYVGWDIDHHDGDPGDPAANWRYACILCLWLARMGANPLLEDSNGSGGYHIWLRFSRAHSELGCPFGRQLARASLPGWHPRRGVPQATGPDRDPQVRQPNAPAGAAPQTQSLESVLRRREVAGRRGCLPLAAGLAGD